MVFQNFEISTTLVYSIENSLCTKIQKKYFKKVVF